MANQDAPFGAVPIGTTDGSDYHAKMRTVEFLAADSVAAFTGDFVKLTGTTGADGKIPVVAQAAAGEAVIGAIVSFEPNFEDEGTLSSSPNHKPASTSRLAKVCFGSEVLYSMQEDADGGAMVAADAGLNVDIVVAAGSAITGTSGMEIDSSTALQASGQLRIHHLDASVDTVLGTSVAGLNAKWVVSINENQDARGAGV